jgi:pimeloyl-ACP methyl ester carboxylesterase
MLLGLALVLAALPVPVARGQALELEIERPRDLEAERAAVVKDYVALRREIAQRLVGIDLRAAPGRLPRPSASALEAWLALATLQLDKARDHLGFGAGNVTAAGECVSFARTLLAVRTPSGPPDLVRLEGMREHAYFARDDNSAQPYYVFLPSVHDGNRPLPLVLFLHGYVPDTSRTRPYLASGYATELAEKHGVLLVAPHGRTNTDFQYVGEADVLRVKAEVEKFYRVDPERVYLLGVSMGGAGAWQVGMHYPDLFAGVAPINGQGDWFRFWHSAYDHPPREELPRHMQYLLALNNPLDLAANLCHTYSYSQHATQCFLGPEHTRDIAARLAAVQAPFDTFEDPSPLGHYIYWRADCWQRAFAQLLPRTRRALPESFQYSTWSLRHSGAWWAEIRRFQRWGQVARIEARRLGTGAVELRTENVAEIALRPELVRAAGEGGLRVTWNDTDCGVRTAGPDGTVVVQAPGGGAPAAPARLVKDSRVCGPASDLFLFPFVAVRGTRGSEEETAALEALARQFVRDYAEYAEGAVRVLRDDEVTDELIQEKGLVLFGLPETNSVLARLAAELPFRLSREAILFPDGRRFAAADTGLLMIYPNPLNPTRYIWVCNGLRWGEHCGQNHRFDRLPDFTVFTREPYGKIGSNAFLAAGLFDENWQYQPDLTDFAEPPPAAPAPAVTEEAPPAAEAPGPASAAAGIR